MSAELFEQPALQLLGWPNAEVSQGEKSPLQPHDKSKPSSQKPSTESDSNARDEALGTLILDRIFADLV